MQRTHISCVEGFHPGINKIFFLFWMPEGWPWMKECDFRTAWPQGTAQSSPNTKSTNSIPTARQKHIHTSMLKCCRQGNSFLLSMHEYMYIYQRVLMVCICSAGSIHFPLSRNFQSIQRISPKIPSHTYCYAIKNHNVFEA